MPETPSRLAALLAELRRRRVFRVAIVYAGVAFIIFQIVDATFEPLRLPDWAGTLVVVLLLLGFFIAVGMAWAFDLTAEGTNEILRLFIALAGMQAPGEYLKQLSRALRDPIKGFGFLADYALTWVRETVTDRHLTTVHPALKEWADRFTHYVERFHLAVNSAIVKFGRRVVDWQLMLERFADAAIDLYGMLAVLSRVTNRINAVGEEAAWPETDIARIHCEGAWRRVRRNLRQIRRHQDRSVRRLAAHLTDRRHYDFPL